MSALSDRLTDENVAVIARIILNVRQRIAAERAAERAAAERAGEQQDGHHDAA